MKEGRCAALMKGSLHTEELLSAALAREAGLRTERRVSHCFVLAAPLYPRLLLITDAAVNIAPDLRAKADIARNAIGLAQAIGIASPKVAILSAVETVTPDIPSTLDAAALCKMADRGQITGGVLDGPLAFDNAVSPEAARAKGIVSPVAGQADILLCPDLRSGNMLAKQLAYLGGAESAGHPARAAGAGGADQPGRRCRFPPGLGSADAADGGLILPAGSRASGSRCGRAQGRSRGRGRAPRPVAGPA